MSSEEKDWFAEAEGEVVWVRMWKTHSWHDGVRWPIIFPFDINGDPDYDQGGLVLIHELEGVPKEWGEE